MSKNEPAVDIDTIKADIAALRDDIGSITASAVRDGADTVRKAGKAARDKVASALEQVQGFVEERPVTAMFIAFGAGLLASSLLRRR